MSSWYDDLAQFSWQFLRGRVAWIETICRTRWFNFLESQHRGIRFLIWIPKQRDTTWWTPKTEGPNLICDVFAQFDTVIWVLGLWQFGRLDTAYSGDLNTDSEYWIRSRLVQFSNGRLASTDCNFWGQILMIWFCKIKMIALYRLFSRSLFLCAPFYFDFPNNYKSEVHPRGSCMGVWNSNLPIPTHGLNMKLIWG